MRVLVAEDNPMCCEVFQAALEQQGWKAQSAMDGLRAQELLNTEQFDVMLLDINLPEIDGFELMQTARRNDPNLKIVVISGSIGVTETVRALKLGACECFPKPFNIEDLMLTLKKFAVSVPPQVQEAGSDCEMVAVSKPMLEVRAKIRSIARSRTATVLILGETGSGKEVVARRLHRASERKDKPFVAVNCSAIPHSLVESELFGHEKGAFTDARATRKGYFEAAGDGTIFLDEIGDLSLDLQTKLLRVLQERSFRRVGGTQEIPLNARIIAATNVDLALAVRAGRFREDLYYRLAVIPIHLQPLRERKEDILPLAERFLTYFAGELQCEKPILSEEHKRNLMAHTWPGNVRELRNVIERFVLMGRLEFVSSTRNEELSNSKETDGSVAIDLNKVSSVNETERKMIYSILLQKLMDTDKPVRVPLNTLS